MLLYFYLLEARFFHEFMRPALALAYGQRSFAPCGDLCRCLLATHADIPPDSMIRAVIAGLPFERGFWRGLVGECLVHGARDIPRIAAAPESLLCLLAPDHFGRSISRADFAPIQQVHFGTREVRFGGGFYRPDHAGLNDQADVSRLAECLAAIDTSLWTTNQLKPIADLANEDDRAEELAYVRDWWPSLVGLYQDARDQGRIVVCEQV